jgi:hypothetical protein
MASVHGWVTDPSEVVVIGAEVAIKSADTNESVMGQTDQAGLYVVAPLRPGRYVINAQKNGFKTVTVQQFNLNAGDNL